MYLHCWVVLGEQRVSIHLSLSLSLYIHHVYIYTYTYTDIYIYMYTYIHTSIIIDAHIYVPSLLGRLKRANIAIRLSLSLFIYIFLLPLLGRLGRANIAIHQCQSRDQRAKNIKAEAQTHGFRGPTDWYGTSSVKLYA